MVIDFRLSCTKGEEARGSAPFQRNNTVNPNHFDPTSPRSIGFCAIWGCISPSSSLLQACFVFLSRAFDAADSPADVAGLASNRPSCNWFQGRVCCSGTNGPNAPVQGYLYQPFPFARALVCFLQFPRWVLVMLSQWCVSSLVFLCLSSHFHFLCPQCSRPSPPGGDVNYSSFRFSTRAYGKGGG